MPDSIDLTVKRMRNLDRKVSDMIDRLETLIEFVSSLDGHIIQLHNDRRRQEIDLGNIRNEVSRIKRQLEFGHE